MEATPAESECVVTLVQQLIEAFPPESTSPQDFLGAQFDAGLAWVHFPPSCGGLGLARSHQVAIDDMLREAGAARTPEASTIGTGMGAPVVQTHGNESQKQRYLRTIFTGEEIWCQLFSEPGAGSDVAGLSTSAVRDGEHWVVNGQKVWTTVAHMARWGMLVARTDPDKPKHSGLTYFVVDMHAPGVEVRPLRQMTGDAEFNEVFFTDVRVPDTERLGAVGEGWKVVLTTLMNERVTIGGNVPARGEGVIDTALMLWEQSSARTPVMLDRLMSLWIEAECVRLTALRAAETRASGVPGPEGSTGKLASTQLNQKVTELCVDLLGPTGLLYESYEMQRPGWTTAFEEPQRAFLRARANTIEGGTSEVMKNILGERVLGLPGDIRVDRDLPWRDVPRS